MDKILRPRGFSARSETRESLDEFRTTSQDHLARLAHTQQLLQKVTTPFQGKGEIRPIHCRLALESLEEVNECIAEFRRLFYDTTHLPLVIVTTRYQTLFHLHDIESQISLLKELLVDYRKVCILPSKLAQKHRATICKSFEKLLQSFTDISQQVLILNDEARFQERKLLILGGQSL